MNKFKITLEKERAYTEDKDEAKALYTKSRFGEPKEGKIQYSLSEALYLLEKSKALIYLGNRKKALTKDEHLCNRNSYNICLISCTQEFTYKTIA